MNVGGSSLNGLDQTPNHQSYPGSQFDNIKNNMGAGAPTGTGGGSGEAPSSSDSSTTPSATPTDSSSPTSTSTGSPPTGTCASQKK